MELLLTLTSSAKIQIISPNSSTRTISSLQIREQVLSSISLPLLKCLHSTHSLLKCKISTISWFKGAKLNISVCKLTSSWYRRRGRWDTCHTWLRRHLVACTRRLRTRTDPSHCTGGPGWTYKCLYVWSSYSSHPASLVRTGRSHSYRHRALRINKKQEEDNVTRNFMWKRGRSTSWGRRTLLASGMVVTSIIWHHIVYTLSYTNIFILLQVLTKAYTHAHYFHDFIIKEINVMYHFIICWA